MRAFAWVLLVVPVLACVDRTDPQGMTALMRSARAGDLAETRRLLDRGADPNLEVAEPGPIGELLGFLSAIQGLPGRSAGWTALDFAVVYGHREVVRALLEGGADPSRSIARAEEFHDAEMAALLREAARSLRSPPPR